jgi:Flp pilus assembly CpaE family ATPase
MPEGTTCLKAIEQLCGAAGLLASDVVMWTVADQIEQPDRLHQKQVGSIAVRHERQVDLYIIQDAKRRQVVMISSKSHGANNVVSAITIIFLCFVAGFTATELHSLKLKMQGIAAQDITPL